MAPSPETLACLLNGGIRMKLITIENMDTPSRFKHVLEETGNDIFVMRFLLKIPHTFEVGAVFLLVG